MALSDYVPEPSEAQPTIFSQAGRPQQAFRVCRVSVSLGFGFARVKGSIFRLSC